jgi:hypothetical protein
MVRGRKKKEEGGGKCLERDIGKSREGRKRR